MNPQLPLSAARGPAAADLTLRFALVPERGVRRVRRQRRCVFSEGEGRARAVAWQPTRLCLNDAHLWLHWLAESGGAHLCRPTLPAPKGCWR
ncbi:hypothetical protein ACLFKX_01810 [Enterobacter hormaechei]